MEVYIKPLMQCNLRCVYCYEQGNLSNRRVLSLTENRLILRRVKTYAIKEGIQELQLAFTGGEFLMLGPQYLGRLLALSRRTFRGAEIDLQIVIQTNLTLLNAEYIRIFKKYKVSVGSSYDVIGGLRRFQNGLPIDKIMLDKIISLFRAKMRFYGIAVITKSNYRQAKSLHRFYKDIYSDFHVLPLDAASEKYCPQEKISVKQYIQALKTMAREQLKGKKVISVSTVDGYAELLWKGPGAGGSCLFSKQCLGRRIFIQNDGEVYPCDCLRGDKFRLGNIFKDPLEKMLSRPILSKLKGRQAYIDKQCQGCKYLPLCNGGCMISAYEEDGNILKRSRRWCRINRAMFKYVGKLLKRRREKLFIQV